MMKYNKTRRVLAVATCMALLLGASACGKTAEEPLTTIPEETSSVEAVTQAMAETTVPDDETVVETETAETTESAEPKEIKLQDGLTSKDVEQVMTFYKLAAAKNTDKKYHKQLDLISINGGEGSIIPKAVSIFEPVAKKAVSANSIDDDTIPGDAEKLRPTDWTSAEAVSDGKTTTITVQVKTQTDGPAGKCFDGPVGRTMTVLDGIQTAMDELPGVSADFEHGSVYLEYQNPVMTVKIDNATGDFVKGGCRWYYRVHPVLEHLDGKMLGITVPLKNADGYVDYTMTY